MSEMGGTASDDDFVYRRIPAEWIDPKTRTIKNFLAFIPNQNDHSGLSVELASRTTPVEVASKGRPGKHYHVARLSVKHLRLMSPFGNLSVVLDNSPPGSAHCVIPQMSRVHYEKDKATFKAFANQVLVELGRPDSLLGSLILIHPADESTPPSTPDRPGGQS
jgi:hypothetical protein